MGTGRPGTYQPVLSPPLWGTFSRMAMIYWKRKLAAYLHDSPDKVLSILDHEERARRIAGEIPPGERSRKEADWAASAADRLPFPPSSETRTELSCFRHPLGGSKIHLNEQNLPVGAAEETSQRTRPILNENDPRAAFITTWRFWRNWAASHHADFALYPAETRLPDHTIWNHLAVTSAMQGCLGGSPQEYWEAKRRGETPPPPPDSPAFLLFTIGPVQDFIAAARSTRDLWSGSYLLSYLIGHVLSRIALDFGPDHVIFPNLCDQPIMDLLLRDEIWNRASTTAGKQLFEAFDYYGNEDSRQRLLTPSLPNRFLAVLPANMTEHRDRGPEFESVAKYAHHLAEDLRAFLKDEIAGTVSTDAFEALGDRFNRDRFHRQVARMLEIHWQVLPWPGDFPSALTLVRPLPGEEDEYTPRAGLNTMSNLCQHGADGRYLDDGQPKNVSTAWSALYAATEWLLDGAKANRGFLAADGGHLHPTKENSKDSLNGREEAVLLVGDEMDAADLSSKLHARLGKDHLIKSGENLGAGTLIKRLWPYSVVCKRHAFKPCHLHMPNTRSIAAHEPCRDDDTEEGEGENYFAVLALDGDSMGKWISGAMTPKLEDILSEECAKVYRDNGANLAARRPLSPAWHLQFSEALGNYSQHAARRIVEAFDGRLIYAGGDDVLAMLPADAALQCARALRLAFKGDPDLNNQDTLNALSRGGNDRRSDRATPLFEINTPGFLRLTPEASKRHGSSAGLLDDPVNFPVIVPGSTADCSVGIAIAHFKSPLQDVVRAAQAAEKRAKNQLGRGAVAVSLFKRSGEITEWGCKWDDGGLDIFTAMLTAVANEGVSGRFPHRVVQLLEGYLTETAPVAAPSFEPLKDFPLVHIVEREFRHALDRQGQNRNSDSFKALAELALESGSGPETVLNRYVAGVQWTAEEKLQKAAANPAHWEALSNTERRRLEIAPSEAPLRALIGLCQTVAFIERNLPKGR